MAGIGEGLNSTEVSELINYIQQNNSWQNAINAVKQKRRVIKYYDMSFDSRSGEMWCISFRVSGKEPIVFRDGPNFKKEIYNFLDTTIE